MIAITEAAAAAARVKSSQTHSVSKFECPSYAHKQVLTYRWHTMEANLQMEADLEDGFSKQIPVLVYTGALANLGCPRVSSCTHMCMSMDSTDSAVRHRQVPRTAGRGSRPRSACPLPAVACSKPI